MRQPLHILLLILTIWSFQIGVKYRHVHKLPDGSLIEHSHPYHNNQPGTAESHCHSFNDFPITENFIFDDILSIPQIPAQYLTSISAYNDSITENQYYCRLIAITGRAPPLMLNA